MMLKRSVSDFCNSVCDSPKTENGWDLQRALMLAQRVFNRSRKISHPPPLPLSPPPPLNYSNQNAKPPPPPPLNYGYQSTNPPPLPLNFGYQSSNYLPQSLNDGSVSTLLLYQAPTPRASVPRSTNESSVPRNNIGSSGSYGVISGGRADSFQNYGFVGPYGRANSDGENTAVGGAATSDPYWSNMEEPSHKGAKRTSSFTYSNIGCHPTSLQAPSLSTYFPSPSLHTIHVNKYKFKKKLALSFNWFLCYLRFSSSISSLSIICNISDSITKAPICKSCCWHAAFCKI
ncbi:hypothetical protein Peur_061586 [Populus x canadensis]